MEEEEIACSQTLTLSQDFPFNQDCFISLSQEDFELRFSQEIGAFDQDILKDVIDDVSSELQNEDIVEADKQQVSSTTKSCLSTAYDCLPSLSDFRGIYGFDAQIRTTSRDCHFENEQQMLYVNRDTPCSIGFFSGIDVSTKTLHVRLKAVFKDPAYIGQIVTKCPTHRVKDKDLLYPDHLICAETPSAKYYENSHTQELSVVVPFHNPPIGDDFITYPFKFMCLSSCAGGIQRRNIVLVITLEEEGDVVVGRRCIPLKICASPIRDSKDKKKKEKDSTCTTTKKRKVAQHLEKMEPHGSKRKKIKIEEGEEEKTYWIKANDVKLYKHLKETKYIYLLKRYLRKKSPEQALELLMNMKKDSSDSLSD